MLDAIKKCTAAIGMIAFCFDADFRYEYRCMVESTVLKCAHTFSVTVRSINAPEHLYSQTVNETYVLLEIPESLVVLGYMNNTEYCEGH